jgi:hypothetical protein
MQEMQKSASVITERITLKVFLPSESLFILSVEEAHRQALNETVLSQSLEAGCPAGRSALSHGTKNHSPQGCLHSPLT